MGNCRLPPATSWTGRTTRTQLSGLPVINPNLDATSEYEGDLAELTTQNSARPWPAWLPPKRKSGSNEFHGSAFEYRRADAQQARDPFSELHGNPLTGRYLAPNSGITSLAVRGADLSLKTNLFFRHYQGLGKKLEPPLDHRSTALPGAAARPVGMRLERVYSGRHGPDLDPATNQTALTVAPRLPQHIPAARLSAPAVNSQAVARPQRRRCRPSSINYSASGSGIFDPNQVTTSRLSTIR